jgi:DNA-binding MarR family transcriptional regulator
MATISFHEEGGWLADWQQASRQLRKLLADRLTRVGLTESRAAVLDGLRKQTGPCSQTELADDLNLSDSNLCGLIERMQREGLVTRSRSPLDRRKFLLALTPAGKERVADVRGIRVSLREEVQQQLPADMASDLESLLRLLILALQQVETRPQAERRMAS